MYKAKSEPNGSGKMVRIIFAKSVEEKELGRFEICQMLNKPSTNIQTLNIFNTMAKFGTIMVTLFLWELSSKILHKIYRSF